MRQNGFTLVELLVGLLIGMLCIIMMLMLFKQIFRVGMGVSHDAEYDSQLETGVLISQKLLQNAGYGSGKNIDIATGFVTFTSSTQVNATVTGQPAIFWRIRPDLTALTFACFGLTEAITQDGEKFIHRLVYLQKLTCDSPTAVSPANPLLGAMTGWTAEPIVKITVNTAEVADAASEAGITAAAQAAKPIFTYSIGGSCSPFGVQNLQGGAKVTVTGNRLNVKTKLGQTDSINLGRSIQRAVCLRNIP